MDGQLYVWSGYMNSTVGKLWKSWPVQAEKDGRAVVRVDGVLATSASSSESKKEGLGPPPP